MAWFRLLAPALFALAVRFAASGAVPEAPSDLTALAGDRTVLLYWQAVSDDGVTDYRVYRRIARDGVVQEVGRTAGPSQFADLQVSNGQPAEYRVHAVNQDGEGSGSAWVAATANPFADDEQFLEFLQHTAFAYFWREVNPANGLVKDRSSAKSKCSIAATGFGLTAIAIAVEHRWITREQGRNRALRVLTTFYEAPQAGSVAGVIGYKGWFYHFLEMATARRAWNCELSSIDTALFLAGALDLKEYFDSDHPAEAALRSMVDAIYRRIDWRWMANDSDSLSMGWKPESGFIRTRWIGYNEAMILYILGLGAPENPLPPEFWQRWTSGYRWRTSHGLSFLHFGPLFGHQYSHCWVDFRGIADEFMRGKGVTYFENSRRATLAQRLYCQENPKGHPGYGLELWGLTACDGPGGKGFLDYSARGAPPSFNDDGTIAPTAAGGSLPFAPEVALPMLRHLYDQYRVKVWTAYGFRDAFNLKADWWDPDVLGIDQGPILIMAENYRSGRVWKRFMRNENVRRGLERAGFLPMKE